MRIIKHNLNVGSRRDIVPRFPEGIEIPRILHQTFHTRLLPQAIHDNVEKIRSMNPDWEYRYYDDADIVDFIRNNYSEQVLGYFARINPMYGASRADLFRYLLMYKCGGVYIDIKSSLRKPLADVLRKDDRYLLSGWKDDKMPQFDGWGVHDVGNGDVFEEYQQWHIAAAPGHPFLRAVIENVLWNIDKYIPSLHGVGKPGVLSLTGPVAYTSAIRPLLHLHQHRVVQSQSDLGFQYSVFDMPDGHNSLFKAHYSDLSESIIQMEGKNKIYELIFKLLKKIRGIVFS